MKSHSRLKALLAVVLAATIVITGCSGQWINLALQDPAGPHANGA